VSEQGARPQDDPVESGALDPEREGPERPETLQEPVESGALEDDEVEQRERI